MFIYILRTEQQAKKKLIKTKLELCYDGDMIMVLF